MRRLLLVAASLALLLAGTAMAQGNPSYVQVVHAVPNAPTVDVLVDRTPVFRDVAYMSATGYGALDPGSHSFEITPATDIAQVLASVDSTLAPAAAYSIVAVGTLEQGVEALVLTDDLSAPPSGQAKVRFVNASANLPPADLVVVGGATLFSGVNYKEATSYTTVPAGTYTLNVREPGTYAPVVDIPSQQFSAGTVYTVYVLGVPGGQPPLQALVVTESVNGQPVQTGS